VSDLAHQKEQAKTKVRHRHRLPSVISSNRSVRPTHIFFQCSLEKCTHISLFFFFTSELKQNNQQKKTRNNQSIKGLIIIVYCNTGRLIDEDIFFPSGHKYTCKENCYFSFPFFLIA
jgi:hypothetical protein